MSTFFPSRTLQSKLPNTGASIFSEMTMLAQAHQAINLAQGFPDFQTDPHLIDFVSYYMKEGANQYAPMAGVLPLREAIAEKIGLLYGVAVDQQHEITITAGATQAISTIIATMVRPGDEVILFEPAYDCYAPTVELHGGIVKSVVMLAPDFLINWSSVADLLSPRTRMVIINNPTNPSGKVWSAADLRQLDELLTPTTAFLVSDEVYEHMVYDQAPHLSVLAYASLRERAFVVASFGKLLHVTGWKVGYAVAPPILTEEFRKVHQFMVFSVNTAIQLAIADYIREATNYQYLSSFFEQKRNLMVEGLQGTGFKPIPCPGTYFMLIDYSAHSALPERAFAELLTRQHGLASVPLSAFYTAPTEQRLLRICFAKQDHTLEMALERFSSFNLL